ncbi:uncharacterized protein LOC134270956 isoform X2 [Saccostrea cucullata]|uniref:uncharacterized protein LOC134270956 isoform X2 n=1 Tax=Saccostrea cuccullata TaxID=36930 RepID=UPI002ED4C5C3
MASKLLPTDQQNFVRLGIAVVDKIKLPMKDILILSIKPINLYNAISSCTVLLTGKYKLNDEQRKLCFLLPPDIPDYGKFDVSLLYKLIQNLCPHLVPTQGWGKQPKATDIKIADDIERLRQFRNGMLGHLESSSIPDALFEARWAEIEDVMKRMDSFLRKQGFNPVNYEKELADVRKCNFGFEDMEKFKLMLEATLRIMKEKEEFPTITLRGNTTIICGEAASFEAEIEQTSTSTQNWPITWHKVRGNNLEQIDTSTGKYTDSTNRQLVIQRASKEDQGDYQAIISGSSNGQHIKIPSNVLTLKVTGERPVLKKLEVTSGKDGITLHYKYEVSQDSPKVHHIAWTKNGQVITKEQEKYLGGDLINSSLTITSPSLQDSGEYTCIIANAVGAVAESIILGVPKVSILAESVCYGENTDINSVVSSCPPAERAVWEKSIDAVIFETIYVRDRKYANSILDPSNPVLRLTSLTFDDKLYYRLRVWNSIGECVSNTILLKVTGDPPNISNGHETNIKSRIVILTCQVFLYKQSPLLSEIAWKKDGSVIDIFGSGGKYTGGTLDEPSLTITNVNQSDAGNYQCKASNAVGSTIGNKIILGVPELEIQGPNLQEIDKKVFTALIKSVPEPIQAQWSIKNASSGSYKALDITSEEYKGSSNNLPKPLLCIKQNVTLQNHLIHIEVQNFIGTTTREIPDERCSCSNEVPNTKATSKLTAIFSKKGSSIRFNNLKLDLIREISERDLKPLISTLTALTSMELLSLDNLPTIEDLFIFLLKEEIFQERNVIMMQYLMRSIKRPDLELKCVEYAIKNKQALCYFEENKIPGDGCKHVQIHVVDDIATFTDIDSLLATVAAIVGCDKDSIKLVGLQPESSFVIVISMKECFARKFGEKGPHQLSRLLQYNVDWIKIENKLINIQQDLSLSQHLDTYVVSTSSITVPGVDSVYHISCVTSDRLWVSEHRRLLQVDNTGHVIQKLKIDVTSYQGAHSVAADGDMIFINGDIVQKMTLGGTVTTLFRPREPLFCIHSSRNNGDILVGYKHGVFRCDWRGNHRIELEDYRIHYPTFITENNNGDIWVSDIGRTEVVVMDKSGQHRFNYRGQHQSGFFPGGICTDIHGQVLVCDLSNSSVHLLDQDGQFLRLLLTQEHGLFRPTTLCVDDKHNLYVGDMYSNTIKVYKYLQETEDSKSSIVESK